MKKPTGTPLQAKCPACGRKVEVTTKMRRGETLGSGQPRPGDFSLCPSCGAVGRFDETLQLQAATLDDFVDLKPEALEAIMRARATIRARGRMPS